MTTEQHKKGLIEKKTRSDLCVVVKYSDQISNHRQTNHTIFVLIIYNQTFVVSAIHLQLQSVKVFVVVYLFKAGGVDI